MINKYKKISIIYGGSGRECAMKINEKLQQLHYQDHFPIKSTILAKEIMGSASIFKTVRDIISSSSLSIIILTFDDFGTRVRQNVLIEIGMTMMAIQNVENCIFLSEKVPLPEDFPSDLKGFVNPNYFDKNNLDEVADTVAEEIKNILKNKNYKGLLKKDPYIYNFEKILDDIPGYVFEEKADIQLEHILDHWKENINSFEFVSEKIMYLIERLKFFPDFNCNEKFFAFLADVKNTIHSTEIDIKDENVGYLNTVCTFVKDLIDYTDIKLRKDVVRCMHDPSKDPSFASECELSFERIANSLRRFVDKFESDPDKYNYNWLIKTMAYEYVGLAIMKVIAFRDKYDKEVIELINYVIESYKKALELAEDYGGTSAMLWRGYTEYNLTRAYEAMYKITNDEKNLVQMRNYSRYSIATRHQWCQIKNFKGVFTSALSYEYFLVKRYELVLRYKYDEYSETSIDGIKSGIRELSDELKKYCDATELGRLYDIKNSLDEFYIEIQQA